jgi:putative PEP-CTERM system histidine kinase
MAPGSAQLFAWSHALTALVYGAFAWRLYRLGVGRAATGRIQETLLLAVLLSALWGGAGLAMALTPPARARWLAVPLDLLDLARYAAWLAFLMQCLRDDAQRSATGWAWMLPTATLLVAAQLLALLLAAWSPHGRLEPARLALLGHLALPVLALVLLEQVFSNLREDARWAVKPLCLGLLGLLLFDQYLYAQALLFNQADANTLAMRGLVHAGVVPLLALSVIGRPNGLLRLRLSPKAAFHSVALLAVGLYLLLLSGVGYYVRYFGGDWGRALQLALVFLGLVGMLVLLLSGSARAKLRVLVGKHLFHYRFDYREEWLRFTHTLSARASSADLVGQQVIRGLADMLESPSGALWTQARNGSGFSQSARWNQTPVLLHEAADSPLCRLLTEPGWVINLNVLREQPQAYGALVLPAWLRDVPRAWLVIPLVLEQGLIGFCVLDQARTQMEVDWEVNDLLKTAGQQAASYLAQAQGAQALLEARKFEAFSRMSAFIAHDLKNIVTQLALMLGNAKRLGDNPAFQQDMLMTIEHALDRMRHLLLQLGQPAPHHAPVACGGVELLALLQGIAEQCRRTRGQRLDIDSSEPLQVRGHSERLERVLGHMVHNALDATAGGGRVWASLVRSGNQAQVCIGDSGCGMSASFIQNQLFKPFQSTKPTGMGIGAFESLQYVQELGGSIAVDSTEGQGTRVTLQLPLFEAPQHRGPQAVGHTP